MEFSILTESEKTDPFAPEHIDSNNVLEAELAAYEASPPPESDATATARKSG